MADNKSTQTAASPENKTPTQGTANIEKTAVKMQDTAARQTNTQSIKETANNVAGQAKEKAVGLIDEQKNKATTGLSSVADSIRKVGENLRDTGEQNAVTQTTARYGDSLAKQIESFSGYLEDATLKDLTRDIERFARRQPALFVGGAVLVGILAARFLKTSAPRQNSANSQNR